MRIGDVTHAPLYVAIAVGVVEVALDAFATFLSVHPSAISDTLSFFLGSLFFLMGEILGISNFTSVEIDLSTTLNFTRIAVGKVLLVSLFAFISNKAKHGDGVNNKTDSDDKQNTLFHDVTRVDMDLKVEKPLVSCIHTISPTALFPPPPSVVT